MTLLRQPCAHSRILVNRPIEFCSVRTKQAEMVSAQTEMRLIVVAENMLARAGLAALLEQRGFVVVAQQAAVDLERFVDDGSAHALVVDLGWQSERLRRSLADWARHLPVLALVDNDETEASLLALAAMFSAGPGFAILPSDSDPDAVASALYAIDCGLIALDPDLRLLPAASRASPLLADAIPLTERENEVLRLLAQGMTNKAIALALSITESTVKFHVNAIMGKLGAQSRTEAVVRATQLGIIML